MLLRASAWAVLTSAILLVGTLANAGENMQEKIEQLEEAYASRDFDAADRVRADLLATPEGKAAIGTFYASRFLAAAEEGKLSFSMAHWMDFGFTDVASFGAAGAAAISREQAIAIVGHLEREGVFAIDVPRAPAFEAWIVQVDDGVVFFSIGIANGTASPADKLMQRLRQWVERDLGAFATYRSDDPRLPLRDGRVLFPAAAKAEKR